MLYTPQPAEFLLYCCRTGLHLLWARTTELCFTFAFTIHHFLKPLSSPPLQQSGNPLSLFLYQDAPPCLLCALCVVTLWYCEVYCRLSLRLLGQNASGSQISLLLLSNVLHTALSALQTDTSPQLWLQFINHSPQHQRGLTHNLATPLQWTCISPWPDAERAPAAWSISVLCLLEQLKALLLPTSPSSAPLLPSASLQTPS